MTSSVGISLSNLGGYGHEDSAIWVSTDFGYDLHYGGTAGFDPGSSDPDTTQVTVNFDDDENGSWEIDDVSGVTQARTQSDSLGAIFSISGTLTDVNRALSALRWIPDRNFANTAPGVWPDHIVPITWTSITSSGVKESGSSTANLHVYVRPDRPQTKFHSRTIQLGGAYTFRQGDFFYSDEADLIDKEDIDSPYNMHYTDNWEKLTIHSQGERGGRLYYDGELIDPASRDITISHSDISKLEYYAPTVNSSTLKLGYDFLFTLSDAAGNLNNRTQTAFFWLKNKTTSDHAVTTVRDTDSAANQVAIGATSGTYTGLQAFAEDADLGARITYALENNYSGLFGIDTITGKVHLARDYVSATDALSGENQNYLLTVRATSTDSVISVEGSYSSQQYSLSLYQNQRPSARGHGVLRLQEGNTLEAATEDQYAQMKVSTLLSQPDPLGAVSSDPENGSVLGAAIISSTAPGGSFYYSVDGGETWLSMGDSLGARNSLLLKPDHLINYVPSNTNTNGLQAGTYLEFRA